MDKDSILGTPSKEEGSSGERKEQTPEADVQEGSQFDLWRRKDSSSAPVSSGVTLTTRVSL